MATGMLRYERSVDCLVLCHHDQDRKILVCLTMAAMFKTKANGRARHSTGVRIKHNALNDHQNYSPPSR